MPTPTHDIVQKLWSLCDVLRDDGVSYQAYVTELTYLLFIKMANELALEEQLPSGYDWNNLRDKNAADRLIFYRKLLLELGTSEEASPLVQQIYANATSVIRKPTTLTTLVEQLDKLSWFDRSKESFGDLYEGLLEKNAGEKKSGAGQYFTPRVLIDSIIRLMQPTFADIIQDPAAGTGGFLIAAAQYMRGENDSKLDDSSEDEQRKFYTRTFYGMELVQDTHRLALMNLMLHDLRSEPTGAGIRYGDTLGDAGTKLPAATLILSNPPFGTKKGGGTPSRDDFTYPTSNKQFSFLQHIYRGLKNGGRAAVVLPDNVLFEGNVGKQIREDLMHKCNLHTILRLPTGIFYAQGVKTNVLFFSKVSDAAKDSTKEVWVYDLRANMPSFGKRTQLTAEHFADFEAAFGDDSTGSPESLAKRIDQGEEGRFRCFSRDFIAERNDSLDISWLKDEDSDDPEDLPEPAVLAQSALTDLQAAMAELEAILEDLGEEAVL